ncbi:DUF4974 domain-containing protein [Echinicola soli]|uniref:DUF4974 domain-containing protein n=1 Tax=Echinicola soli TaxID=2591634 RepID=A0A514CN40_9BACT|nr:FecR family protein [Echinicola soli]QDH81218.1 DUF4974 domain-containing protein [Echinicola soli]
MSENSVNIDFSIIWKKLHASLSEQEEQQLQDWLAESNEHQAYFDRAKKFYKAGSQFGDQAVITEKDFRNIDERLQRVKPRKWNIRKFAAVIVLMGLAMAVLKSLIFDTSSPRQRVTSIQPGTEKAILLMDDGTSYDLSSGKALRLNEGGSQIVSQGKSLKYNQGKPAGGQVKYNTLVIPLGGQFNLTLTDGTKIWLNAGSTLKYPTAFSGSERRVELTGEAYFEVARNEEKPFKVHTEDQVVEVLGTAFNISSYQEVPAIYTTLVEGRVKVFLENNPHENQILSPNQQSVLTRGHNTIDQRTVDVREYISWKDGWFYFHDKPLKAIMDEISRWYEVDVQFKNIEASELPFTGEIRKYKDLEDVLILLEKTRDVQFRIERRTIIIE